ncbi:AAA family ATPase [Enterococcus rivorum]|uniref:ABC transporter ATP-binding protein n=2 Tax=Enterococcus rivorum TaxID=762845 RepID=A0A1E5KWS1_9ENTE|nr:AAA family ATPase [Enterococcus rivorum]MBP2100101.1 putative ATPase [Enterococcus rivorum]OEH82109.1 ABC transporter ATP-binding protein [Enterococcus rivorum]
MNNILYLKQVIYENTQISEEFPFNLPTLRSLNELVFDTPVTFFIGENGIGKSTIIETIAALMGLNMEGGSKNNLFSSYQESYPLLEMCRPVRYPNHQKDSYFYRAESYFNLMTDIEENVPELFDKSLHHYSRGESLSKLVSTRFFGNGFYILDEPETGLSLSTQLSLMLMIEGLVQKNSQFIIATHSPILLFFPDAKIYEFSDSGICETKREETKVYQEWKMIFDREEAFFDLLFQEEKNI